MVYALLKELAKSYPEYIFYILCKIPITVPPEIKDKIKFVNLNPIDIIMNVLKSDIFIFGGGTHFHDTGTSMQPLITGIKQYILFRISRIACSKIYFLGIGAEPLTTKWGKGITKKTCELADFISVRDKDSNIVLKSLGLKNTIVTSFDLAALLLPEHLKHRLNKEEDPNILGVSILPFFDIYYSDKKRDYLLIHAIGNGLNLWLEEDKNNEVQLFIFNGGSFRDDVEITELLGRQLKYPSRVRIMQYDPDPLITLSRIAKCHAFLGMRYHSCVFAYLTNTPLLVINYFEKCKSFAEYIGLPKEAIISPDKILSGELKKSINLLIKKPVNFEATLPIETSRQLAESGILSNNI